MSLLLPPGLVLIAIGLALPFLPRAVKPALALAAPLVALLLLWALPLDTRVTLPVMGWELVPLAVTKLGRLFATVFCIMAFAGTLFAVRRAATGELAAALFYAGSAIGVTLAGDLVTVLIYWELMAIGSTLVLWTAGTVEAHRASMRYLMVHLLGGFFLMAGVLIHAAQTGGIAFQAMQPGSVGTWLILLGFLVNAGAPPFSAWLPDAYPEASPFGSVFLSAFTTKTAVYTLIVGFPGTEILIWVGLFMVFYGIVYAILENDIRRILAYSIVNQVGFMVTAVGIGTEMALNGASAHAFVHIIYKALLLMSAGSVVYMTGKRKCTDVGGLFRTMPITMWCGIIGALSISAFPLTSGFVAKSMISSAAGIQHLDVVWLLLTAASAGVFLHAGIKFPWFVFFQKDSGLRPPDPPAEMRIAMILLSAICLGLGAFPGPLYAILPFPVDYVPYTGAHVVSMLQLLLFSGLAFFLLLPWLKRSLTISLDLDWFYRVLGPAVLGGALRLVSGIGGLLSHWTRGWIALGLNKLEARHGIHGSLAQVWPIGSTALWIAVVLAAFLLIEYMAR